jgi:hypothetical protein
MDYARARAKTKQGIYLGKPRTYQTVACWEFERGESRFGLAAQPQGDQRGEPSDDEPRGVDQHPFFFDVRRRGGISLAEHLGFRRHAPMPPANARMRSRGSGSSPAPAKPW